MCLGNFDLRLTNSLVRFADMGHRTVGLRGGQHNATRSIAAGIKILDRAVKSVMKGVDSLETLVDAKYEAGNIRANRANEKRC